MNAAFVLMSLAVAPTAAPRVDVPKEAIVSTVRDMLLQSMPNPLYEASPNWGHTVKVPAGVKWKAKGGSLNPQVMKKDKNHGKWQKILVTAPNLANNLEFDLRNLRKTERGTTEFEAFIAFNVDFDFTQQNWANGVKLYDSSVRGRLRMLLTMTCELSARMEKQPGSALPDLTIKFQVQKSDLRYDKLVFEHVGGLGGEAAQLIGETAHGMMKQWKPSFERDMLARANAAIVKAGQKRELHVSFSKLFGS